MTKTGGNPHSRTISRNSPRVESLHGLAPGPVFTVSPSGATIDSYTGRPGRMPGRTGPLSRELGRPWTGRDPSALKAGPFPGQCLWPAPSAGSRSVRTRPRHRCSAQPESAWRKLFSPPPTDWNRESLSRNATSSLSGKMPRAGCHRRGFSTGFFAGLRRETSTDRPGGRCTEKRPFPARSHTREPCWDRSGNGPAAPCDFPGFSPSPVR